MHNSKSWWLAVLAVLLLAVGLPGSYIVGPTSHPITPSTGTPSFVQTAEAHTTGGGSLSVSFGSLPAISNVVIVGVALSASAAGSLQGTINDNQNNPYVRVNNFPINGAATAVTSFWCAVVTTSSGTFTVTLPNTTSATLRGIMIFEYANTSCNPDKSTGASGATSPYSCGSITTINAKDLLLTAVAPTNGAAGTVTFTPPAGFTIRNSFGTVASGLPFAVADDIVSVANTYSPTFGASQDLASTPCILTAMISQ